MTTPLHAEPVAWTNAENMAAIARGKGAATMWPNSHGQHSIPLYAAAPDPDGLREAVWQAVMLGGDAWGITDRVIALLAAPPAQEGKRGAVEIVTEWLAMAEAAPKRTHGVLRYPQISQGELDAIALLAALRHTDTGWEG